jgi:hypothetical protein
VTADAFGNLWGKCMSSMKKCIFISLEKCFCTVFGKFFKVTFDCTCTSADQSQYAGIVYYIIFSAQVGLVHGNASRK